MTKNGQNANQHCTYWLIIRTFKLEEGLFQWRSPYSKHGWQSSLFIITVPQVQQAHKIRQFWPFHGLLAHWRQHSSRKVVIPVCQYSGFALAILLYWWRLGKDGKNESNCLVRLLCLRSLQKLAGSVLLPVCWPFNSKTSIPVYIELNKPSTSTITWSGRPLFYANVLLTRVVSNPIYVVYMIYGYVHL